jgi:hypothetical protein
MIATYATGRCISDRIGGGLFSRWFFKLPSNSGSRAKFILRASSRVIGRSKTDQEGHGETIAIRARQPHLPCEGRP